MNRVALQTQSQTKPNPLQKLGILQRKCACGNHTVAGGQCGQCGKKETEHSLQRDTPNQKELGINTSFSRTPAIQRKLTIGASNDPLEQEADRVADQVLSMPANPAIGSAPPRIRRFSEQPAGQTDTAPASVNLALASSGRPLESALRLDMEQRFGHDFSRVRLHSGAAAEKSTLDVNAEAYTVGHDIVFGAGGFAPGTPKGRRLIAHELTHVVQQLSSDEICAVKSTEGISPINTDAHSVRVIQRACLSASVCGVPILGSAEEFSASEATVEQSPRRRRARMSPARKVSTGHAGHARQLERFLQAHAPGLLGNVHGIFIDRDVSSNTAAYVWNCASFDPPITGATKPCVFVPPELNRQALRFNTDLGAARIGGSTREDWRISTLQILVHEIQHVLFSATTRPTPPGVSPACSRSSVEFELGELSSIMSEFPFVFRAIPIGAAMATPARARLANWFNFMITNNDESIRGALTTMRCSCDCADVDKYVIDTFNFTASSWTTDEKNAFNDELRRPVWGLDWPL